MISTIDTSRKPLILRFRGYTWATKQCIGRDAGWPASVISRAPVAFTVTILLCPPLPATPWFSLLRATNRKEQRSHLGARPSAHSTYNQSRFVSVVRTASVKPSFLNQAVSRAAQGNGKWSKVADLATRKAGAHDASGYFATFLRRPPERLL